MKRIIVAITGASGTEIGIRLVEELSKGFEVHATVTENGKKVIEYESNGGMERISKSCHALYDERQTDAPIASGSFKTEGMIICPCTMKTLSAIANGYAENLVARAADVCIKQKRKLVLVPRESPLSAIHLENMLKLSRLGIWIIPPLLTLYHKPKKIEDTIDFIVGRVLEAFEIEHNLYEKWGEK